MSVKTPPFSSVPPPPDYLPEMEDEPIVKNTVEALSPRIVAVHGPTKTGKSTVFPLAITHWAERTEGLRLSPATAWVRSHSIVAVTCLALGQRHVLREPDEDSPHLLLPSSSNSQAIPNISSEMQVVMLLTQGATNDST